MVFMYLIFVTQSSVKSRLDCFHVLAIMNNAAMNNGVHISLLYI